jgi:hypothetical protein
VKSCIRAMQLRQTGANRALPDRGAGVKNEQWQASTAGLAFSSSFTANYGLRMQKDHVEPLRGVHAFPWRTNRCLSPVLVVTCPPGLASFLALSIEDDKERFDRGEGLFFFYLR